MRKWKPGCSKDARKVARDRATVCTLTSEPDHKATMFALQSLWLPLQTFLHSPLTPLIPLSLPWESSLRKGQVRFETWRTYKLLGYVSWGVFTVPALMDLGVLSPYTKISSKNLQMCKDLGKKWEKRGRETRKCLGCVHPTWGYLLTPGFLSVPALTSMPIDEAFHKYWYDYLNL